MTIVNTLFKQPVRRLYTWKSPGDVRRNQIDYILMSSRFKNSAVNCKTYPGADIGSDHNPVIMQMKVKLKIPHSKQTKTVKYCTKLIRLPEEAEKYAVLVKNKFECLYVEEADATRNIDQQWDCLKEAIEKTYEEFLPRTILPKGIYGAIYADDMAMGNRGIHCTGAPTSGTGCPKNADRKIF
ncbi:craniofacial development protein 2-like [Elysia marginata]|uniref:Craniofacial development protein 2-like n=1 Tax=Elysia marginata TaxID=1093978 RepID=A0AAV4JU28_9GAST|nr:craniofacial development protein 2-like [Elysia marginata]